MDIDTSAQLCGAHSFREATCHVQRARHASEAPCATCATPMALHWGSPVRNYFITQHIVHKTDVLGVCENPGKKHARAVPTSLPRCNIVLLPIGMICDRGRSHWSMHHACA